MAIDRRRLLLGAVASGLAPPFLRPAFGRGDAPRAYLSGRGDDKSGFYVAAFDEDGMIRFDVKLPQRAHAAAIRPDGAEAAIFARRPGHFLAILDVHRGEIRTLIDSAPHRHFNGHGVFSRDGALLMATETDYAAGRGVIGLYDVRDSYRRIGEWGTHGLDPHELKLLGDGRTLLVANGGILTDPETYGARLNLDSMAPNLTYLDEKGGLLHQVGLPAELHQLSLRHLAVGPGDLVAVAMQYEGPATDRPKLIGLQRGTGAIRLLSPPADILDEMENYCGSAAMDSTGGVLGITCPRGNLAVFFDVASSACLGTVTLADVCGIAASGDDGLFILTSGFGGALLYDARNKDQYPVRGSLIQKALWDNHLTIL